MEARELDDLLAEIFGQSPLPNRLKVPKRDWQKGTIGLSQKVRIVEEYTDWKVEVRCVRPAHSA